MLIVIEIVAIKSIQLSWSLIETRKNWKR